VTPGATRAASASSVSRTTVAARRSPFQSAFDVIDMTSNVTRTCAAKARPSTAKLPPTAPFGPLEQLPDSEPLHRGATMCREESTVSLSIVLLLSVLTGQTPPASPPACNGPEFTEFDFWIGEWEVFGPKGNRAGHNSISRAHGGCVVLERWAGNAGFTGSSFNIYTPATKKWHQIWVDSAGTLLQLDGEFRDGSMRMEGPGLTAKGATLNRITWTPRPDGTIRQLWEISTDSGKTWQASFDGTYRKSTK
jgi:hypothetical protein